MENKLLFLREIEPIIKQGKGRLRKRRVGIYRCECGNENTYVIESVKCNHTKQCIKCARKSAAKSKIKHGNTKHPLYRKWQDMKNRCYNQSVDHYKNYGGRGIGVCEEWVNDFTAFYNWCMLNNWEKGLEIDRLNVNENYSPNNCRITTHEENAFNKTNTRYVEWNGEKICLAKLLKQLNLHNQYHNIYTMHVRKGKPLIEIILKYK